MQNDPNKPNRIKYLLPWIGMAAVIGLMWRRVTRFRNNAAQARFVG